MSLHKVNELCSIRDKNEIIYLFIIIKSVYITSLIDIVAIL